MPQTFPFCAIVGQESLKRALLLAVIQPRLGGVLIRGVKGSAKSTAVRGLAGLLPPIETVAGCPVQRHPGEVVPDLTLPGDAALIRRQVPLVELPLGATEDRVLGSLHLERALRGERAFEPGLLAAANRGILYVDEVNLLPDHLVDVLLDASASGIHRVEREGLSLSHPARFVLVGTMNPEEGELRPQLLDRFGLVVDVNDLADPVERAEAVRRRLAFEADPEGFRAQWQGSEETEAARIVGAQRLLAELEIPESVLQTVSARCLAAGAEGLRADLTVCRAACAWAAYHGRRVVESGDIDAVAELALVHRRNQPPLPPDGRPRSAELPTSDSLRSKVQGPTPKEQGQASHSSIGVTSVDASAGLFRARRGPSAREFKVADCAGKRRHGRAPTCMAPFSSAQPAKQAGRQIAWASTLRAASRYQSDRGRDAEGDPLILCAQDLFTWPRRGPAGCLRLFLLDTSGSMAARRRMRQTKAVVLALLAQAYRARDRVALLACHGASTELVLPPCRGMVRAHRVLEDLPAGGTTPLAHGLATLREFLVRERRRRPRQPIWTVILTDGRSNVALGAGGNAEAGLRREAYLLGSVASALVVVDTESGWRRFGRAVELARSLRASCFSVADVLGAPLVERPRKAM